MQRFKIFTYFDISGNRNDGWKVGHEGELKTQLLLPPNATDEFILTALKNVGYFIQFLCIGERNENRIEIVAKEDKMPLFRLEKVLRKE